MRDGDKDESEKYYPSESERVRIGGRIEEGEGWELMPMVASALIDIFEGSDKGRQAGVRGRAVPPQLLGIVVPVRSRTLRPLRHKYSWPVTRAVGVGLHVTEMHTPTNKREKPPSGTKSRSNESWT